MDRSAAYAARWVAKSLVKAGLCKRVLVQVSARIDHQVGKMCACMESCSYCGLFQVSYAIGIAHPLSVSIFHYGTSQKSEKELLEIVAKNFDLRPGVIVRYPADF